MQGKLGTPATTAQVHPGRFTEAMLQAAVDRGAQLRLDWVTDVVLDAGRATAVGVEVDGKVRTSEAFARELGELFARDKGTVAFVIGGAEGIPHELSQRAALRLSLSSFTMPHRLARIVLYEQLYRALSILRGEPYAREG